MHIPIPRIARLGALVAALALCCWPAPVTGQTIEEIKKSPNWETAKRYHQVAQQLYNTGRYAQAVVEFKKAYDLAPLPELLHNIGRCHEVLAELKQAVKYYELYLQKKPDSPNRPVVEERIRNLNKRIEAQAKPAPAPKPAPRPTPKPAPKPEPKPEPELAPKPAPVPPTSERTWRWTAGWVGVGLGAAALGAGIAFGALAGLKQSAYEDGVADGKTTYEELQQIEHDGQNYEATQIGALVSGAVLAAAGAGLLIWEVMLTPDEGPSTAAFLPYGNSDGAGVVGIIRF